jgi:hypothetical protein
MPVIVQYGSPSNALPAEPNTFGCHRAEVAFPDTLLGRLLCVASVHDMLHPGPRAFVDPGE